MKKINEYIKDYKDFVYIFYTRIIDVELPELRESSSSGGGNCNIFQSSGKKQVSQTEQVLKYSVNSSLIRMQDLQLIGQILREQHAILMLNDISYLG